MTSLRPLAPDLWHLEVHQHRAGFHFRNRMVVARRLIKDPVNNPPWGR